MARTAPTAAAAAALALLCVAAAGARAAVAPPLERLVGQKLVVAADGTAPSSSLLARIRRGEVGGVILFGGNIASRAQTAAFTARLRAAARAGGAPDPLVAVDQEGGRVRRLRWAPPGLSAADLASRPLRIVRAAGRAAGLALRRAGIDVDLAPVADVPVAGSFLLAEGRTLGRDANSVSARVTAFTAGLADARVAAAAKHFPGIGRSTRSTDRHEVVIRASSRELAARDLVPFRDAVAAGVPLVMLANAAYTAYGSRPAAWSPRVVRDLRTLGFSGPVMTDAVEPLAATRGVGVGEAAVRSVRAGADLVLLSGDEASSERVFGTLLAAARAGLLDAADLRRSEARILELKRSLG